MSVDLKSVGGAAASTKINTVVNFKEARAGNVILCAGPIYIYTMRAAPMELRIINVGNGNSRELFKQHKSIPTVAKLANVGIRQNMIASGSDTELIVWSYQTQAITTFFTWTGVKVSAVEWVKAQDSHPSLIVMYSKNGGEQKLGVINTKKVMERYSKAGLDAKTIEITAEDVNEPTLAVAGCDLLAAGILGDVKAIAAASSTKAVTNVVFSDNTTAKVALPDNEVVKAIYINEEFFLIVAGAKGSVVVYNLRNKSVEKAVLTAKLPAGPIASAALGTVVSFLADGVAYTLQITLDGAKLKAVAITEAVQAFTLVEDNNVFRGVFDTEKFLNTGVVFDKTNTAIAMDVSKAAQAPAAYNAAPARSANPISLKNNTLANVTGPASISAAQSQAVGDIDAALDDLRAHITATQETIATYGNKTHKMDLEMVIQHALEAQVTELLKLRLPAASSTGASAGSSADLDESFVIGFRTNLANNISAGITAAIDSVAETMVAKIRDSGKKSTKKAGTEALKRRLDEFVGEANAAFATALTDRMKHGEGNFKNSVGHLNRANDEAVRILQQQVDDLNGQLRAVATSGIIEEVKRLRKEVAQLKVRAAQTQAAPVNPDTLIQTAIATIDAGNVVGGFEYAVATNNASVVASVLVGVKDQAFESTTLSTDLWSSVLTLGAIGAQTKDEAVAVLNAAEVVKDDETILSVNASKARVALKSFSAAWKGAFSGEAPLRNQLKSLDIELGSK